MLGKTKLYEVAQEERGGVDRGGGGVRIQIVLTIVTTFDIYRPVYDYSRVLHKFMITK